ncbi:MAG: hypothetical protein AAFV80_14085, partial [Bacteroidota bacterium]
MSVHSVHKCPHCKRIANPGEAYCKTCKLPLNPLWRGKILADEDRRLLIQKVKSVQLIPRIMMGAGTVLVVTFIIDLNRYDPFEEQIVSYPELRGWTLLLIIGLLVSFRWNPVWPSFVSFPLFILVIYLLIDYIPLIT